MGFRYYSDMTFLGSPCTQTSDLLLLIFSLAHARSSYLRQVIKAHNTIIYTVVTTLRTSMFTENNHNNQK